jgi:hypothetical protein
MNLFSSGRCGAWLQTAAAAALVAKFQTVFFDLMGIF